MSLAIILIVMYGVSHIDPYTPEQKEVILDNEPANLEEILEGS